MAVQCSTCGTDLNATQSNMVVCENCHTIHNPPQHNADLTHSPERFAVSHDDNTLKISYGHDSNRGIGMVVFALLWTVGVSYFILPSLSFLTSPSVTGIDFIALMILLSAVPFLIIGILFLLQGIALILNTSQIIVDGDTLQIKHSPIPLPPSKTIPRADIKQIYTIRRVKQRRSGEKVDYRLYMQTQDDNKRRLLPNFDQSHQLLYLEREIEKQLNA